MYVSTKVIERLKQNAIFDPQLTLLLLGEKSLLQKFKPDRTSYRIFAVAGAVSLPNASMLTFNPSVCIVAVASLTRV